MNYNPYHYPVNPYLSPYMLNYQPARTYPPVNTKVFSESIQSLQRLMEQGHILLDRLANPQLSQKVMNAAQQGKHAEVNRLIQSLGLKAHVKTTYTPSSVNFELTTPPTPVSPVSCCTLNINMRWGH